MILKVALCMACVQIVVVGVVTSKSHVMTRQHSLPYAANPAPLPARAGQHSLRHLIPHPPGGHGPDHFRVRAGRRGAGTVHVCGLCPASVDITPCTCECLNETAAELVCGPELASCSQLTEVLSLTAYPVNTYLRLVVQNTQLGCKLEKDLWGPLAFREIVITNNSFQVLDNLAFQPFSGTLTSLNLDGNSLRDVYFSTMSDTPLLTSLTLRYNAVEFLPGYSTIELPVLETFSVAYNKIEAIYPQTFAGMPKLRFIDLSNNAISKVSASAFAIPQHASSSLSIDLAHNLIAFIEPGILEGVRECSIDLQYNLLTTLSEKVFRPIIDFTAASSVFWTLDNPLICDSQFCWIATNKTVSGTFKTVLCPNLDNMPVQVLAPMCTFSGTPVAPRRSRKRPRVLPIHHPPSSFGKNKAFPEGGNHRKAHFQQS